MTQRAKPARYRLSAHPAVPDDLTSLAVYGPQVVIAARAALDDLAYGRVTGKLLGARHVSGDLTGLASVKFDIPGSPTRRFRLVYGDIDAQTRGVLAIGGRSSTDPIWREARVPKRSEWFGWCWWRARAILKRPPFIEPADRGGSARPVASSGPASIAVSAGEPMGRSRQKLPLSALRRTSRGLAGRKGS